EVREIERSPLSQSTRPFPPGGQSWPRKRPAVLQKAPEWLQIVRDTIEIPLGHGSRRGRQNRPALCALRSFWLSINKQIERLQRADRNVLEHKVAVGRQRQSFDNRPGFFNRCGVHKEDHAARLILAEPELVDLPVEIELQSVGDFLRQDPLPLLVR